MTTTYDRPPGQLAVPGSPRVRLAELVSATALRVPGVVALTSGPSRSFITAGENVRVDGVRCVAAGRGSYEVSLRLGCELVPLIALADVVRAAVARAATAAGITVSRIDVLIGDVVETGLMQ